MRCLPPLTTPLLVADGTINYVTRPFQGHELLVGSDGSLWLWALSDNVITEDEWISLIYGRFLVGPEAELALGKPDSCTFRIGFKAHGDQASCTVGVYTFKHKTK